MIRKLKIANLKAFGENAQIIPIKPITLVLGPNSGGKSSLIHSLALAHEAARTGNLDVVQTEIGGSTIDLGGFRQYIHRGDLGRRVSLTFEMHGDRRQPDRPGRGTTFRRRLSTGLEIVFGRTERGDFPHLLECEIRTSAFRRNAWIGTGTTEPDPEGPKFLFKMIRNNDGKFRIQSFNTEHPLIQEMARDALLAWVAQGEMFEERTKSRRQDMEQRRKSNYVARWILGEDSEIDAARDRQFRKMLDQQLPRLIKASLFQAEIETENIVPASLPYPFANRRFGTRQLVRMQRERLRRIKDYQNEYPDEEFEKKLYLQTRKLRDNQKLLERAFRGFEKKKLDEHLEPAEQTLVEQIDELKEQEHRIEREKKEMMEEQREKRKSEAKEITEEAIAGMLGRLSDVTTMTLLYKDSENEQHAQRIHDALQSLEEDKWEAAGPHNRDAMTLQLALLNSLDDLVKEIASQFKWNIGQFEYLSAIRHYPSRHVFLGEQSDTKLFAIGEDAWNRLIRDDEVRQRVNHWLSGERMQTGYRFVLKEFIARDAVTEAFRNAIDEQKAEGGNFDGLFGSIAEESFETAFDMEPGEILEKLVLQDLRTNTDVTARDIGVGVSQMIPILVRAFAHEDHLIAIEEPESQLHPALGAELGDVFIESALGKNRNRFILETHSENLILRILRRVRQTTDDELPKEHSQKITPDDVAILYVNPTKEGSEVIVIPVTEDGEFAKRWPGGFFSERLEELIR